MAGEADALAEENRRLREELEAMRREREQDKAALARAGGGAPPDAAPVHPSPPRAAHGSTDSPSKVPVPPAAKPTSLQKDLVMPEYQRRFYVEECLRSNDFKTPRSKAAVEAINTDVTHEFFSAHEKNTALNVQRDIRQSIRIAGDRLEKLEDAMVVLKRAYGQVQISGDSTAGDVEAGFVRFNTQLDKRESQFMHDLDRHMKGELKKIRREKEVVEQLLVTLESLVTQARNLMSVPDELEEKFTEPTYKTLAEIKDEFTQLRQVMLPWDMGYLFDMITAKASEQMIDVRTTAVHDIISRLIEMLSAAKDKASATLETLNTFILDVERVVPETAERIKEEFRTFRRIAGQKEDLFKTKIARYKQNYSSRIVVEKECVDDWIKRLNSHTQACQKAIDSGNDHVLLQELGALNQALIQIDGSTLTLGYDNIAFKPVDNILVHPLDQLGVLVRDEMHSDPKFSPTFHYYQFLEHKEYMYGGSETKGVNNSAPQGITAKEKALFETSFKKIDRYNDGTLDEEELEVLWSIVFPSIPREAITCITKRIFDEINTAKKSRIHFSEFISYISEGMHTNLGAQRDTFYRSPTKEGAAATGAFPHVQ